jgi:WD40 repeat protein
MFALVIGIDEYADGIPPLETAVADARAVARVLIQKHGCRVLLLTKQAVANKIRTVVSKILPRLIREDCALIFYFAGHGLAAPSETGPRGYLVPAKATRDPGSFLEMSRLHTDLGALPCRHLLAILDCCFAGAFRWGAALGDRRLVPDFMFRRTYELYVEGRARQVLVSAAADQAAIELLSGEAIRGRTATIERERHSPFALALLTALTGRGPEGKGGVLTVTELSGYLRRQVEALTEIASRRQTPQLWPLEGHDKGEFIFHVPGQPLALAENPRLTSATNPYRDLRPYEAEDVRVFHGRTSAIVALLEKTLAEPFIVVLGESGSGKSSLLRAGLLPRCGAEHLESLLTPDLSAEGKRRPLRPGSTPVAELVRLAVANGATPPSSQPLPVGWLAQQIREWLARRPTNTHLLLCVDQFEELVTLGKEVGQDTREQDAFQQQLAAALAVSDPRLHVLLTLRSDYANDFSRGPLKPWWQADAVFHMPLLASAELRQIAYLPAASVALDFADSAEVDFLVTEVTQTPNPLPILSCVLTELYENYVAVDDGSRSMKLPANFAQIGGVAASLSRRGDELRRRLPDDFHRVVLDNVLLRFVSLEGGRAARRPVLKEELLFSSPADRASQLVLKELVQRRLVVGGQTEARSPVWEMCHDRLLTGWAYYRSLIKHRQDAMLLQRRLSADVGAHQNLWHNDPRLEQVRRLLDDGASWLNRAEEDFVHRSVAKKRRRFRLTVAGVVVTMLILAGVAGFALIQRHNAQAQAEKNFAIALAARSEARPDAEADLAVLLAMAAGRILDCPESRYSLFAALARRPQLQRSHHFSNFEPFRCVSGANGILFVWGQRGLFQLGFGLDGAITAMDPIVKNAHVVSVASDRKSGAVAVIVGNRCLYWRDGKWQQLNVDFKDDDPCSVAWQPAGDLLAVGCLRSVRLVRPGNEPNVIRNEEVPLRETSPGVLSRPGIGTIAWKPDGSEVAGLSGPLMLFVPTDGQRPLRVMNRLPDVTTISYKQGDQQITENQNGERVGPGKGTPLHFAWHPDPASNLICTPTTEGTLSIWNAQDGDRVAEVPLEVKGFARASWSAEGDKVAVANDGNRVFVYAFENAPRADMSATPGVLRRLHELKTKVSDLTWLGGRLATVEQAESDSRGIKGAVRLWTLSTGDPYVAPPLPGTPRAMAWTTAGDRLAVATADGRLRVIRPETALLPILQKDVWLHGFFDALGWTATGNLLCFGHDGLRQIDPDTPGTTNPSPTPPPPFGTAFLSPDGRTVVLLPEINRVFHTVGPQDNSDNSVLLLDSASGSLRAKYVSRDGPLSDASWRPDGVEIAIVDGPRIALFRPAANELKKRRSLGENASYSVPTYSPDGSRLAAAMNDGEVRIWDTCHGRLLCGFRAHTNPCRALAWLSDELLATGNLEDDRIMIWQVATAKLVGTLPSSRSCEHLAAHPRSGALAMMSQQHGVQLFQTDLARLQALAKNTVNRNLTNDEWRTFVGTDRDHQAIFPNLPSLGDVSEQRNQTSPAPSISR